MTDIPHDHLGQPDLQALVRQCGGFDKISLELWTAWDRANAEWQERAARPANHPLHRHLRKLAAALRRNLLSCSGPSGISLTIL